MPLARLLLLFLAAHLATALCFVLDRTPGTTAAWGGLPLDDAWIHLVYARSLAALEGFAFNPGQLETGSTSPLWAMLLVPATWTARLFHVGIVIPAKLTTLLAATLASGAAAHLLRGLGFGRGVALAAGLALAVDPALAFAQVSGMEVMLASALALWALAELCHERYRLAGLAAGLAPLARPELALLTVLVLATAQWRLYRARASWRTRLSVLLPTLVATGAWVGYCLAVSGRPLPSTFYAKFASREDYLVANLQLLFTQILPASPWFAYGAGAVLWAVGAVAAWRRGLVGRLFALYPLLYLVGVSASQLLKEAEPFYYLRYVLPAHVFLVATLALGAWQAVAWVWQRRRRAGAAGYAAGVGVLLVLSLLRLPTALCERAHRFAWNCQNIEELNVAMAVWLRDHVPAGESIAVNDAGAARYFGDHRILDMIGLNHHRLQRRERAALAELDNIGFLSVFPSWMPWVRDNPVWTPMHRTTTQNLTICRCPQSEIVAYRRSGFVY